MAKRDEEGRLISDPDAEPWDSATDDPMGEVPMPKEKLPPKKDPKQSKLKLTSEERAFHAGWAVLKQKTVKCTKCGKKITEGYLDQAAGWFCSDKCLNIDSQEHKDAFESGDTVWTTVE